MSKYYVSKTVRDGSLVRLHGNKIVLCSKIKEATGIYTKGDFRTTITMDGVKVTTTRPEGIVIHGQVYVRSVA
jgi:hypothetical protein